MTLVVAHRSIDPQAFAFQTCDVALRDGSPGPVHWLCDVVRVLEAFGEPKLRDIRQFREKTGFTHRGFAGVKDLVFDEAAVGDAHIFRTPYSQGDVFCDEILKDACKQAGMKGVMFGKANHKR
jgi:hypothetical protein